MKLPDSITIPVVIEVTDVIFQETNQTFEVTDDGVYQHPVFKELHDEYGSGWFSFVERLGLGGIFRLTSRGVIPFNCPQDRVARFYDAYDILRAVELGVAKKLQ